MADTPNQIDPELIKIDQDITKHRLRAVLIIILVAVLYVYLANKTLPDSAQSWGTFGDFIGGILNPIFALFAFYWLTYSVRLQIKELKEAHIELRAAAKAQADSAKHQETIAKLEQANVDTQKEILELQKQSLQSQIDANAAQQQQIAIQNFESLFFELLKAKMDVTDNIVYQHKYISLLENSTYRQEEIELVIGKKGIEFCIFDFKSLITEDWETHYTNNLLGQFGSYFRLNYQILKLIHTNTFLKNLQKIDGKGYSAKQKEYFDIFRATFNQYELEAHFFNCLSSYGNDKFKKMIEIYGLFEPLLIDNLKNSNHCLTKTAYQYDPIIFEKNDAWHEYFKDLAKLDLSIDPQEIKRNLKYITNTGVHLNSTGLLNFEEIKQNIAQKIEAYSEKFKNTKNRSELRSDYQKQYDDLHVFKNVEFTFEMYLVLKYHIDLEEYINHMNPN